MSSFDVPSLFRKRDLVALVVMLLALYISIDMHGFNYSMEPDWYIDHRKSRHHNPHWSIVPPIVTDLNGDGENELIVITRDSFLKILTTTASQIDKSSIYTPVEKASVRLNSINIQMGTAPVALETGYVETYSDNASRKQVIVLVREDWTVSCFDSSLKLLWEKAVSHKSHELSTMASLFKIDDVSIFISPITLDQSGEHVEGPHPGIVVVGASMTPRDEAAVVKMEEGLVGESGSSEHPELNLRAALEHFSVFALKSTDGHVIWRHDGSEVKDQQYTKSMPQHLFKHFKASMSNLANFHESGGLNDWSLYRQSLVAELPHSWNNREDGSMRIAHFVRRHLGAGASSQVGSKGKPAAKKGKESSESAQLNSANKAASANAGKPHDVSRRRVSNNGGDSFAFFTGVESEPLDKGAALPHDATEHIEHPNVLVAHTKRGVEVLALKTGAPITSLSLTANRIFDDIDGDGVVDSILIMEKPQDIASHGEAFAHNHGQLQHCTVMVVSGLPARSQLFNGSICMKTRHLHDPITSSVLPSGSRANIPVQISAATPVLLQTTNPKTRQVSPVKDLVVAIHSGVVTSFSGRGEQKWQINGAPSWSLEHKHHALMSIDLDANRVDELGGHNTIFAQLLVAGTRSMSLFNREGDALATTELPNIPIHKPILGDFDSDGVVDVIMITEDAILGYKIRVEQSVRALFIAVLLLIVIAAIVFFSNIRVNVTNAASGAHGKSSPRGSGPAPRRKGGNVLSTLRSTDEHVD